MEIATTVFSLLIIITIIICDVSVIGLLAVNAAHKNKELN
jgi:hypothetical protein